MSYESPHAAMFGVATSVREPSVSGVVAIITVHQVSMPNVGCHRPSRAQAWRCDLTLEVM